MSNDTDVIAQQAILNVNQLKSLAEKYQQEAQQYQQESYDSNEQLRQANEKIEQLTEEKDGLHDILHYSILEQDDHLSYAEDMLNTISNMIEVQHSLPPLPNGKGQTLRETLQVMKNIREHNASSHSRRPNDPPKKTMRQALGFDE